MKKIFFYMMIATVVLAIACDKEEEGNEGNEVGPNPMTMTTQKSDVTLIMSGLGTVTIDWGDNTEIETYNDLQSPYIYTHVYSGSSIHTVTITGNHVEQLECYGQGVLTLDVSKNPRLYRLYCGYNKITKLDLSNNSVLGKLECYMNDLISLDLRNNTELTYVNCHSNLLTNLDFSKNTILNHIRCENNELTSSALNAMFGTLNDITGQTKKLYIRYNPGTNDCDISIAENKGWNVIN